MKTNSKRDDFNFPIVNVPFISSNIPAASVYAVYISQLIWYQFKQYLFHKISTYNYSNFILKQCSMGFRNTCSNLCKSRSDMVFQRMCFI